MAEEALDESVLLLIKYNSFDGIAIRDERYPLGTPAMTTRGFTTEDMTEVGHIIVETLTRVKMKRIWMGFQIKLLN